MYTLIFITSLCIPYNQIIFLISASTISEHTFKCILKAQVEAQPLSSAMAYDSGHALSISFLF